ncbi:MAG: tyrosine-type recombinase/integrase [Terriglobales bacterium]
MQRGYIYEASGFFYVRYCVSQIVDGKRRRVQQSHRLCTKGGKHYARDCKAVKLLRDEFMLGINQNQQTPHIQQDNRIVDFWEQTYLPFAKENLRASTVYGYEQIWNQHLKLHFGEMTLREYRTYIGSTFLTGLAKTLGRHTLQHVRSLGSGIFSHAVNLGLIESNPWHDVKILGKTKAPGETKHYTLEEAENIISALVDYVHCQLIIALAFFLGLRPGEIQGLRWEDFDEEWVHIRRAVARGVVGETKTKSSVASLPLIAPVRIPLNLWRQKLGNPSQGWVFPNGSDKPLDLKSLVHRVIVPTLKAKDIEWKTLYAGRRGAATILTQLTGDALAAKELLRHKNLAVTTDKYVKSIPEALLKGIKLLETAASAQNSDLRGQRVQHGAERTQVQASERERH